MQGTKWIPCPGKILKPLNAQRSVLLLDGREKGEKQNVSNYLEGDIMNNLLIFILSLSIAASKKDMRIINGKKIKLKEKRRGCRGKKMK